MHMLWSNRTRAGGNVEGDAALPEPDVADLGADAMPAASIPIVHPPAAAHSLPSWVRYSLSEYLRFMWERGGYLIPRRRSRWARSAAWSIRSTLAAAIP